MKKTVTLLGIMLLSLLGFCQPGDASLTGINNFDVTAYVNSQISGDKTVTIAIKDSTGSLTTFSSKEGSSAPTLVMGNSQRSGINVTKDMDVMVYPNPTSNEITLNIANSKSQNNSIILYDAFAKKVQQQKIMNQKTIIDLTNMTLGIYYLQIENNRSFETKRIIKK